MVNQQPCENRLTGAGIETSARVVTITFEGRPVRALEGETVAAALTAAGILALRRTRDDVPRGLFCGMGVCFECLVAIDGLPSQRACLAKVRDGMQVASQRDAGAAAADAPALAEAPVGAIPDHATDILVIGAGPAGLAAAESAAMAGAHVVLVDERPEPGGQYFKQLAASHRFANGKRVDAQFKEGGALIERVRRLGVELVADSTVWGAFVEPALGGAAEFNVGVIHAGHAITYKARQLIIATGAYERSLPVPGWTLPGVMTTGAAQTLGRAYRVSPGSRVLVAGNGPLNLQVACELASGGVKVVAVAESAPMPGRRRIAEILKATGCSPRLMWQGLRYLASLRRHRVPVLYDHVLARVEGGERAERAVLARLGDDGNRLPGSERSFEIDAVCMGYGFVPSSELTRLLGCRHSYDRRGLGSLVVERDAAGATSITGVFAVGDCGTIGGSQIALAQGHLAGLAAARALGRPVNERSEAAARRQLRRHTSFQHALWSIFAGPRLDDVSVPDEALICRCEAVTAGELRLRLSEGVTDIGVLKRLTRAGMGRCQGRYCAPYLVGMIAQTSRRAATELSSFAPRFPVKPVAAIALALEKREWRGHSAVEPPTARLPSAERLEEDREAAALVIGGGILGACTAYYLAREGIDVVVLERGSANSQASGGNAGSLHVQLLSYDFQAQEQKEDRPAADTLPLQRDSARLWPELERELGADLEIVLTGGLMVAEDAETLELLRRKAALERSHGIPVEVITATELLQMAPHVSPRMVGAAWCPEEGKINPLLATPAVLRGALAAGARLFEDTEVHNITRDSGRYVLRTSRGLFRAPRVINCAGAWAASLAGMLGIKLPVRGSPLQMIVTEPAPPLVGHLLAHAKRHLTLKQAVNGNLIIGGGWPSEIDPNSLGLRVRRESFEGNLWIAGRVLPALRSLHVIRSWAAMNVVADGAPILGEAPGHPGFFNAVTVNGVTLAPIIGQINAEMVRTGRAPRDIRPYTLERF